MLSFMSQPLIGGESPSEPAEDSTPKCFKIELSQRMEEVLHTWSDLEQNEKRNKDYDFFGRIKFAKDGGLGDVKAEKLLYSTQYLAAGLSVLFIIFNTIYVSSSDYHCVFNSICTGRERASAEVSCIKSWIESCTDVPCIENAMSECKEHPIFPEPFMIMRYLTFNYLRPERIIACLEFFGLYFLLFRVVRLTANAAFATLEVFRWVSVSQIFWQTMPGISCFSLMRLLYYVTPSVIATEVYYEVIWAGERIKRDGGVSFRNMWPLGSYIFTRSLCAIVGFDAFLLKFQVASHGVLSSGATYLDLFHAVLFLFQVLGVVNLTWFVRKRMFIFIFGAENGDMSNEQKAREIVWNAMVARKIWNALHWWQFLIVMIGFDDYDFQVLVMEPDEEVEQQQKHAVCPAGHGLQARRSVTFGRCSVCSNSYWPSNVVWSCESCRFDSCERCKFLARDLKQATCFDNQGFFMQFQAWVLNRSIEM
mmetsp:Transcript_33274/g.90108  ORF Transcript_33274/g.90108 Transcript_33274/m.90108 type:complete len:478 (-) Transcript_33274:95-1528(-)